MTWKLDADGLWTDALADMRKQADTARWDMPAEDAKQMDAAIAQIEQAVSQRVQPQGGAKIEAHGHSSANPEKGEFEFEVGYSLKCTAKAPAKKEKAGDKAGDKDDDDEKESAHAGPRGASARR